MKISEALEAPNTDQIPGTEYDFHVERMDPGEPYKNKRGEIVEPFEAFTIRWWPSAAALSEEALERSFELEVEPGGGGVHVHWRPGTDDPSGPVTRFVQETLAPELAVTGGE